MNGALAVKKDFDGDKFETRSVSEAEVLGQGDIFHLIGKKEPPYLGVVINADCDLANGKIDGVVSYLPVYTLTEYIHEFWLADFVANQKTQILRNILGLCDASHEEERHLTEWLGSEDCDCIVESLSVSASLNQKTQKRLSDLIDQYQSAFGVARTSAETFARICSNQKDESGFAKNNCKARIHRWAMVIW
ncbi:hypothetical protein [Roseobacter sp. CCS2]|uniref:hypothetical protein n=1 Tax=Roseobacter sp. CCS2 TaxID=391593 RepID=UPI0000F4022E|nr:hypothetical protein [Roseobacter sp. CCS2]EBA13244.1 hypothetical protein RCCS2_05144 [Roseobacter sp. CCS2]